MVTGSLSIKLNMKWFDHDHIHHWKFFPSFEVRDEILGHEFDQRLEPFSPCYSQSLKLADFKARIPSLERDCNVLTWLVNLGSILARPRERDLWCAGGLPVRWRSAVEVTWPGPSSRWSGSSSWPARRSLVDILADNLEKRTIILNYIIKVNSEVIGY